MKELLHFSATWCNPCKKMEPVVQRFIETNPDIKYTKIDVDEQIELSSNYQIKGVPTFIALVDSEVFSRKSGVLTGQQIQELFIE
jgi:thioredoxin 1